MSKLSDVDLVVVGAGAAGIGAGLAARAAGLNVRILEASDRIGGRAHTVHAHGATYDLGCHFLHSASCNPFSLPALGQGLTLQMRGDHSDFPPALFRDGVRQDEPTRAACSAYYRECYLAEEAAEGDVSAASVIDTASPYFDAYTSWCAAIHGVPPDRISTADIRNYSDTGEDWPVKEGYGDLIAGFAAGLTVDVNCPVTAIDRSGATVTVETPAGTLSAKAVVVTVSTAVLNSGAIRFTPSLPPAVEAALDLVPMGYAERVALICDGPVIDEGPLVSHVVPKAGRALGLLFHAFGQPTIGGYLAGDLAHDLMREGGKRALIDYTERAAVEILGSGLRNRIVGSVSSGWSTDPLFLGGYAAALPGGHAARADLRAAFDDRLVLAGEACSPDHYSTAHGAYFTGTEAVSRLLRNGALAA